MKTLFFDRWAITDIGNISVDAFTARWTSITESIGNEKEDSFENIL